MNLPSRSKIRKSESPIEEIMLQALHQYNFYPEQQYPVGPYFIDLALIDKKIAIECDGRDYHSTPEQIEHDRIRDEYLARQGWKTIRISGAEINNNPYEIIKMSLLGVHPRQFYRVVDDIDYENDNLDVIEEKEKMQDNLEKLREEEFYEVTKRQPNFIKINLILCSKADELTK